MTRGRQAGGLDWAGSIVVLVALILGAFGLAPGAAHAAENHQDNSRVVPAQEPVPDQYIVTLRGNNGSTSATADNLARRHSGQVLDVYEHALDGFAVRMSADDAQALAADPEVASVEQDGFVHTTTIETPTPSWGLDRIDQRSLPFDNQYYYSDGAANVHAYIIDTGIRITNTDFGGRATLGVDKVGDGLGPGCEGSTSAKGGHGTHVAGTIGGTQYGVAKSISLVAVRVLDCNGSGQITQVVAGVDWVTANAIKPAVANMSLGGPLSSTLENAVSNSIASGVTYAVAAGNSNANACNSSPADVPAAITVGATTTSDSRDTSYSNYGTCVDLFAPGTGITSDWNTSDTATNTISGTSMATPHVAGVAALYLARNPLASPATVAAAVVGNASTGKVTNAGPGSPDRLLVSAFVPDAPVLTATAAHAAVDLSWTIPADGGAAITGYRIYRGTSSGTETLLTSVGAAPLTYRDSTAAPGTTYYYQVGAVNAIGETKSAEQSATPLPPVAPAPPVVTATPGNTSVHLAWAAPDNGGSPITGYRVYRSTTSGAETLLTTLSAGSLSFDDSSLTNGTTYFYKVGAVNSVGEGLSSEVSATPAVAPSAPTLTATPGNSQVNLSWTVPSSNGGSSILGYRIYRGTSPGGESATPLLTTTSTSASDTSAVNGTTYYYQVGAYNAVGETKSSEKSAKPVGPPGTPVLTATPHPGSVHVGWSAPTTGGAPIDNYLVYRSTSSGTETLYQTLGGGVTAYDDAAVTNGVTYYYQVSAKTSAGEGPRSVERASTPNPAVDVFGRNASNGLDWQHVSGATPSPTVPLGGSVTSNPTAVSDATGTAVFVRGPDGALWWQRITTSGPSSWVSLGGYLTSDPVAYSNGSEIGVFVVGGDSAVYWQRISGTVASGVAQGYTSLGGAATSTPATAVVGTTKFVVVRGTSGAVFFQRFSGNAPSGWQALGGYITSDPTVTADNFAGGGVSVFARGADYSEFRQHLPTTSGAGSGWLALGGNITSVAGAASDASNTFVFVRGADGSVFYQMFTSVTSGTGWLSLGGVATSDLKATFDGTNVRVVVRSSDYGFYWQIPGVIGWTALGGAYTSNPAITPSS